MAIPRVERRPAAILRHCRAGLQQDPNLARIWVGVASCLSQLAGFSNEPEMLDRESVEAARRAVELDPTDADAHAVLGEGLGYVARPPRRKPP